MSHPGSKICCAPPVSWHSYPYSSWAHPWTPQAAFCPVCWRPSGLCCCGPVRSFARIPREIEVDAATPTQEAFVGGLEDACLTLECLKTGATPGITLTIADGGTTTVWKVTTLPDGYQVKSDFAAASPGATLTLEVQDCTARLRWCESVCC